MMLTEIEELKTGCRFRNGLLDCLEKPKLSESGLEIDNFLFDKWRNLNDLWFYETKRLYGTNPIDHIANLFLSNKYRKSSTLKVADADFRQNLITKITNIVNKNKPITLVMPSFPFKSGNFAKCQRRLPDLAEVASLCRLWEITQQAEYIYKPGMQIIILSDGVMLSDVFNIRPYFCKIYLQTVEHWIRLMGMESRIKIFDLNSLLQKHFPDFNVEVDKEILLLKNNLKPEDVSRLYYSLRLNYDNTLWLQEFATMCLNNFSPEVAVKLLERRDSEVGHKIFEYKSLWNTVEHLGVIESLFPDHIRATPHTFKHDNKLTLHLVNENTIILPWMGVGVVKYSGSLGHGVITVKYEHEVNHEKSIPIFIQGEETPFGYILN